MSHFTEDRDDLLRLFLPLDGRTGPARRISRQKACELVQAALEAASTAQPLPQKAMRTRGPRGSGLPRRARPRRSSR